MLPLPPEAWSIFKWSTVICKISAFSSLAAPCKEIERNISTFNVVCHSVHVEKKKCMEKYVPAHAGRTEAGALYLFLKSTWHQSSQLWQTIIDSVTSSFLNNLSMSKRNKWVQFKSEVGDKQLDPS